MSHSREEEVQVVSNAFRRGQLERLSICQMYSPALHLKYISGPEFQRCVTIPGSKEHRCDVDTPANDTVANIPNTIVTCGQTLLRVMEQHA